jgi:hypothetical protein
MATKTEQLQIRVTAEQKRTLRRLARNAGQGLSAWMLSQVLPPEAERFQALAARVAEPEGRGYALAELADWLRGLGPGGFRRAVARAPEAALDPVSLNYLAAAIERASAQRGVPPPRWTGTVGVPRDPLFGSQLASVRPYLLTRSPVALRRRNVFVDASFDQRV